LAAFSAAVGCHGDPVPAEADRPDSAARTARIRACAEDFRLNLGLDDAGQPVSFRQDVMPFLVTHCNLAGCHLGDTPTTSHLALGNSCVFDPRTVTCNADPSALTDDIARNVHANLIAQSITAPNLKRVEPGRLERSFLLMKLSRCQDAFPDITGCTKCGDEMPPNGELRKYERDAFDMLARWVRAGAPFD
jgi:hypothetical protein